MHVKTIIRAPSYWLGQTWVKNQVVSCMKGCKREYILESVQKGGTFQFSVNFQLYFTTICT